MTHEMILAFVPVGLSPTSVTALPAVPPAHARAFVEP